MQNSRLDRTGREIPTPKRLYRHDSRLFSPAEDIFSYR